MTLHTCVDLDDGVLAECRDVFGAMHIRKDFQGAIEDPEVDVICLATTEKLRLPVIALAAKAGKPVYVEKPLAMNLEEMREIQRVVHAANIPFCVGHNRRCQSCHARCAADLPPAHDQSGAVPMAMATRRRKPSQLA